MRLYVQQIRKAWRSERIQIREYYESTVHKILENGLNSIDRRTSYEVHEKSKVVSSSEASTENTYKVLYWLKLENDDLQAR